MGFTPTFNFLLSSLSSSAADYDSPLAWGKVILFLIFLSLIALSLNYFSKKRNINPLAKKKSKLRIVDTCSLGNRQFIVVAQYESEEHLLAVGTSGVLTLLNCPKRTALVKDSESN